MPLITAGSSAWSGMRWRTVLMTMVRSTTEKETWTTGGLPKTQKFCHTWWAASEVFRFIWSHQGFKSTGNSPWAENIADLGGLTLGYYALVKSMEGKKAPEPIDGFTWQQRFFLAGHRCGMKIWPKKAIISQVQTNEHAPARWRINATLAQNKGVFGWFGCNGKWLSLRPTGLWSGSQKEYSNIRSTIFEVRSNSEFLPAAGKALINIRLFNRSESGISFLHILNFLFRLTGIFPPGDVNFTSWKPGLLKDLWPEYWKQSFWSWSNFPSRNLRKGTVDKSEVPAGFVIPRSMRSKGARLRVIFRWFRTSGL